MKQNRYYLKILILVVFGLVTSPLYSNSVRMITHLPDFKIGSGDLIIGSITAIAENPDGRIYLLDGNSYKIYILSEKGQVMKSFGQKGKGPGDMANPYKLTVLTNKRLVLSEWLNTVSIFDLDGEFIRRMELNSVGGTLRRIICISENRFMGIKRDPETGQKPLIVDDKGNVLKTLPFSCPSGVVRIRSGGRRMNFAMYNSAYSPDISTFSAFGKVAIGYTREYKIGIFSHQGEPLTELGRSVSAKPFSKKEIGHLQKGVKDLKWPDEAVKLILEAIPKDKNFFNRILFNRNYILVFRVPDDISLDSSLSTIDIFSLKGEFRGTIRSKENIIHLTDAHLYTRESDEDDNVIMVKKKYQILID
jgi:hypothetical protein